MQHFLRCFLLLGLLYGVNASVEHKKPKPKNPHCVLNTKHPKKPTCTPAKYCYYDSSLQQCELKMSTGLATAPYTGTSSLWSAPTATNTAVDTTSTAPSHTAAPVLLTPSAPLSNIQANPTKAVYYGKSNSDVDIVLAGLLEMMAPENGSLINGDDFASWIDSSMCSNSSISLVFTTAEAYEQAATDWVQAGDLILVTSPASFCGSSSDHDFYNVSAIATSDLENEITLSVIPTDISALGAYLLSWGLFSKEHSADSSYNGSLTYDLVWSIANASNESQPQLAKRVRTDTLALIDLFATGTDWGIFWGDGTGNFIQCAYCGISGLVSPYGQVGNSFSDLFTFGLSNTFGMDISPPSVNVNWGFTIPAGANISINKIYTQSGELSQNYHPSSASQVWYYVGKLAVSPYYQSSLFLEIATDHLISGGEFGYTQTLNDIHFSIHGPDTGVETDCVQASTYSGINTTILKPDLDPSVGYFDNGNPINMKTSLSMKFGIWYQMDVRQGVEQDTQYNELEMTMGVLDYTLTPQPGSCANSGGYSDYKSLGLTGDISMFSTWDNTCNDYHMTKPNVPLYSDAYFISECFVW